MNANELADELDKFSKLGGDVFFGYCADMLRQQAKEIENLETSLKNALLFIRKAQEK